MKKIATLTAIVLASTLAGGACSSGDKQDYSKKGTATEYVKKRHIKKYNCEDKADDRINYKTQNVIGGPQPESYYEVAGVGQFFTHVDGVDKEAYNAYNSAYNAAVEACKYDTAFRK